MKRRAAIGGLWLFASLATASTSGRFGRFPAKTRQAEAKSSLASIYTLEMSYLADSGRYGTLDDIGFQAPKQPRYDYELTTLTKDAFVARATERTENGARLVFTSCADALDSWQIGNDRKMVRLAGETCAEIQAPSFAVDPLAIPLCLAFLCLLAIGIAAADGVAALIAGAKATGGDGSKTASVTLELATISAPLVALAVALGSQASSVATVLALIGVTWLRYVVISRTAMGARLSKRRRGLVAAAPCVAIVALIAVSMVAFTSRLTH